MWIDIAAIVFVVVALLISYKCIRGPKPKYKTGDIVYRKWGHGEKTVLIVLQDKHRAFYYWLSDGQVYPESEIRRKK